MENKLNINLANNYKNNSQKIRIITENWVEKNIFCPKCGNNLKKFENNKPVADFYCKNCKEEFELKSKGGKSFGKKITSGSYKKMIERINSLNNPNFIFLLYDKKDYIIEEIFIIPKKFFVSDIIEKRNKLKKTAKRSGWIGSNILIKNIPSISKVYYIKNYEFLEKTIIMNNWQNTNIIKKDNYNARGWLYDILNCINKVDKKFNLQDIYKFENELAKKHPNNKNIKAKIRQQLQILRDNNILKFLGDGNYEIYNQY